jgi:long-chain acyl-CoA synthetase
MLSVPLIIEKIYRKNILPQINSKGITRGLYKNAIGRKILNRLAGKKLMELFGGRLKFFGIGGAKLDPEVEKFMREAKFPYAIGYGLTETGPLLAGANPKEIRFQSCGKPMRSVQLKIKDPDPKTGEGEIIAKGPNIMLGYYKEPELTKAAFTEDGWFRTGDLGVFDKDGFLYIRGRLKNMILGPSGENIYPEEIEAIINSFEHVNESLVIEKDGKLVALVHFDFEALEKKAIEWVNEQCKKAADYIKCQEQKAKDKYEALNEYLKHLSQQLKDYVNQRVNKSSRISKIEIQKEPFVKTATKKIKRYLYMKKDKN